MAEKGKGATKKEKNNPDVEYTPEELREELASYSKKMEENFAEIVEAKEKIEKLKKQAGLQDINESDIKYYVEDDDPKKAKFAQEIVECIKNKANAQRRNTTIKKKLGEFIEELYNDIIKKLDELEKEHKELTQKEQSGEELTKEEKKRMNEIKREAKILREEAIYLKKEMDKAKKRADALIGDKDNSKKKETAKGDKKKGEEAQQQQQQGVPVAGGAGAVPSKNEDKKSKEAEGQVTTKQGAEKEEEKGPKKEKYLKLKDICDRMQMTDEELSKEGKKKVTKEEIKELDTEFKKIHTSMLKDTDKVDKWDKRILASMLCQDRYYENADKEKRAEYYVETKIKGLWAKFKAAIGKKLPSSIMQQKEMLEEMVNFIQNDESLATDLSERSQRDDLKNAMTQAIASWNTKIENDMAKCQSALPEASEMSDTLEASVEPGIGTGEELEVPEVSEPEPPVV